MSNYLSIVAQLTVETKESLYFAMSLCSLLILAFAWKILNFPWNSLPNEVVPPNATNTFKAGLDKFWQINISGHSCRKPNAAASFHMKNLSKK